MNIKKHLINDSVDFIVMGCDGVFEAKTSQEIVGLLLL